jgi:hypothetical protein
VPIAATATSAIAALLAAWLLTNSVSLYVIDPHKLVLEP